MKFIAELFNGLDIAVSGLLHIEPFPLEKILLLVPTLYWDDYRWRGYDGLVDIGVDRHFRVNHGNNEFIRGSKHVNRIESFWSCDKNHLAQLHGVAKHTFEINHNEKEFKFHHRDNNNYLDFKCCSEKGSYNPIRLTSLYYELY